MSDRVSVIIPCYNKQPYVGEAIRSVLDQTHPQCEVIVVEDGSTDASLDVIKSYDGRIRWTSVPNRGAAAARNLGIDLAQGDYIQFLDADDTLAPTKVAAQLKALSHAPSNTIATGTWRFVRGDGTEEELDPRWFWRDYSAGIDLLLDTWLYGGFFPCHAWLFPAALVRQAEGWNPRLTTDDDGEFVGRLLTMSGPVKFVPDSAVYYRRPSVGSLSQLRTPQSAESALLAWEFVCAAMFSVRENPKVQRAMLRRLRYTAYAYNDFPETVKLASQFEKQFNLFDLSPALPIAARWLIGCLGLQMGLKARRLAYRFKD